ncbi:uncharacterized protein LOC113295581 [Papaver somniferum]|uniref:uncharacterized protein LOC113295581 n=1 Tax=Papaver somniferum TaxID=3469 RepID=UPI000E704938|nr:uncharacterized protein LOC113295581 [Papaver somniferum]
MLHQKARNKWILEGASNSSFLHNSIRIRRGNNTIFELVDDAGNTITDGDQLCQHVVSYYENKFNGVEMPVEDQIFDYDHLSITLEEQQHMDKVLRRYGFSEDWCTWIHSILQSARISVLLNFHPEGFFKINRGLRQGDTLSSLIFVLIEDVLSRNISKLFKEKKMSPMVTRNEQYHHVSGETVCRKKSKIYYDGGYLSRRRTIVDFLGMSLASFPDRYLGVKIMAGADRVVLVKTVIAIYSIHNMAVYKWPLKFIQQCERVIRNFIWYGDSGKSRDFVVGFDKVCSPLSEGGLGLTRLSVMNKALVAKLWWNIKRSHKKWARFLEAKYTCRDGRVKDYGIKSTILPGVRWVDRMVAQNTKSLISDGRSTSLYFDIWSAEESLDHILWSCTFAQSARTWIAEIFGLRTHQDFIIAYKSAEGKSPIVKDLQLISVLVTRSELWNIRNKIVFEKKMISWSFFRKRIFTLIHDYSSRLKSFMFNFVEELQILNFFKVHHRQVNHIVPVEVFWVPPERGEIMLCCDGETRGNGASIAGAGVVVRDEECNVLGAMSIGLGIIKSFLAEIYGTIVGLEWDIKWGIRRVLIWSDSASVIYALENMALPWFVIQRWEDVRQLYDSIRFKHTYRETNFVADIMAKRGCQLGEGEGINYDGRPGFLNSIEYPHVSYFRIK